MTAPSASARLRLIDATVRFGGRPVIESLSADFRAGTVTALIGGDGAGKTTLLSALAHPRRRQALGVTGFSPRDIGYQPASSGVWPNMSVTENLRFVARTQGLSGPKADERIDRLIALTGLDDARGRIGAHLSGGMRQKLGAAMALVHRPALLLLDESTTGVDPDSRTTLTGLMRTAADEGATVIAATTYLDEAEDTDQVLLLDAGRLLVAGTPDAVIAQTPGSLWTRPDDGTSPLPDDERHWQRGTTIYEWRPAQPTAPALQEGPDGPRPHPGSPDPSRPPAHEGAARADRAHNGTTMSPRAPGDAATRVAADLESSTISFLLDRRLQAIDAPRRDPHGPDAPARLAALEDAGSGLAPQDADPSGAPEGECPGPRAASTIPLVSCRAVTKRFGSFTTLDDVDLDVPAGRVVGLIGGNGAGKSTLIRLILGIDSPDRGTIELFGAPPTRRSRRRIGYVAQSLGLYPALSPRENLDFVQESFGVPKGARIRVADTGEPVAALPLGARRMLAVTCALSHSPDLLVLDEPTSGMDSLSRAMLWKRLRRASSAGVGILITTHYQQEAAQCDVLVRLDAGRVVDSDAPH
ncbi:ATP-binding cassette domain-containing protein [Actinomyces sp. B33]|uniref:ATP-binding cassette domain-containing protein n=1 Tax=Actinomyces sp. B33 TaxID=2942131 RepID=UPI002340D1B9|nr:ATP-binding cassette domain-containing protein [Actinomyces sp. B33]MDC4233485.1 ATP-binding cassette domain-containing protein [Actinomyces sp. B33]